MLRKTAFIAGAISAFFICSTLSFAKNNSIKVYPYKKRYNYTLNSNKKRRTDVCCHFVNDAKHRVKVAVWTYPKQIKPLDIVTLLPRYNKDKPYRTRRCYRLHLKKYKWCRFNVDKRDRDYWNHCAYFALADAHKMNVHPFASLPIAHTRHAYVVCHAGGSSKKYRFFAY